METAAADPCDRAVLLVALFNTVLLMLGLMLTAFADWQVYYWDQGAPLFPPLA